MNRTPLILAASLALAACSLPEDDLSEENSGAFSSASSLEATLDKREGTTTLERCTITRNDVVVSGIAASEKINETLEKALFDDCSVPLKLESSMRVTTNANGYLSIERFVDSWSEVQMNEEHVVRGYNFDLRTGAQLRIKDIFEPAAITKAIQICESSFEYTARELGAPSDSFEGRCSEELREKYGTADFTFDKEGIRIHPSLGGASFVLELEGALIPWSQVDANLTAVGAAVKRATK